MRGCVILTVDQSGAWTRLMLNTLCWMPLEGGEAYGKRYRKYFHNVGVAKARGANESAVVLWPRDNIMS